VLQDGTYERVGGHEELHTDVRVIAATHRDLAEMVRTGRFREDLWYRIHVFAIRLPPLRKRRGDIAALAAYFAERAGRRLGTQQLVVTDTDVARLQAYDWPGNVRELAAVIDRAAILGGGVHLDIRRALGSGDAAPVDPVVSFPTLDEAMRDHIERALLRSRGKIEGASGAAKLLGLHANTLRSRMEKLGVQWERFRSVV
jgi:transcriptional regulator with GAF, ATPase, and Fis domain